MGLSLNRKIYQILGVVSVLLVMETCNAFEFKVGGATSSWTVTPNAADIYNRWAQKTRFQIGDTLLFVYDGNKDSVLHVTKDDYTNCNTASPLQKFSDGHTSFPLIKSGPYYFISGDAENCRKNEKLVVVVMADRSKQKSNESPPPPSPSSDEAPSPPSGYSYPNNAAFSNTAGALAAAAVIGFSVVLAI